MHQLQENFQRCSIRASYVKFKTKGRKQPSVPLQKQHFNFLKNPIHLILSRVLLKAGWARLSLCVSCGVWVISDLQKLLCVNSHPMISCTITASLWTHPLRQQHTSCVFWYQAGCWESAGTGKGQESPRSRDRLCSAFALCDTGPWPVIKVTVVTWILMTLWLKHHKGVIFVFNTRLALLSYTALIKWLHLHGLQLLMGKIIW